MNCAPSKIVPYLNDIMMDGAKAAGASCLPPSTEADLIAFMSDNTDDPYHRIGGLMCIYFAKVKQREEQILAELAGNHQHPFRTPSLSHHGSPSFSSHSPHPSVDRSTAPSPLQQQPPPEASIPSGAPPIRREPVCPMPKQLVKEEPIDNEFPAASSPSATSPASPTGRRVKRKKKDWNLPAKRARKSDSDKARKSDSDEEDEEEEEEREERSIWDRDELTPSPPRTRRSSNTPQAAQKQSSIASFVKKKPTAAPVQGSSASAKTSLPSRSSTVAAPAKVTDAPQPTRPPPVVVAPAKFIPAPDPDSSDSDKEEEDPETKDLPWYHLVGTHECPLCQKKMARHVNMDVLHKHLQKAHFADYPEGTFYICTACPKLRFRQAETAKQHRASNTCGGRMLWWHNAEKFGGAGRTTYFLTQNKNIHPIHKKLLEEERKRQSNAQLNMLQRSTHGADIKPDLSKIPIITGGYQAGRGPGRPSIYSMQQKTAPPKPATESDDDIECIGQTEESAETKEARLKRKAERKAARRERKKNGTETTEDKAAGLKKAKRKEQKKKEKEEEAKSGQLSEKELNAAVRAAKLRRAREERAKKLNGECTSEDETSSDSSESEDEEDYVPRGRPAATPKQLTPPVKAAATPMMLPSNKCPFCPLTFKKMIPSLAELAGHFHSAKHDKNHTGAFFKCTQCDNQCFRNAGDADGHAKKGCKGAIIFEHAPDWKRNESPKGKKKEDRKGEDEEEKSEQDRSTPARTTRQSEQLKKPSSAVKPIRGPLKVLNSPMQSRSAARDVELPSGPPEQAAPDSPMDTGDEVGPEAVHASEEMPPTTTPVQAPAAVDPTTTNPASEVPAPAVTTSSDEASTQPADSPEAVHYFDENWTHEAINIPKCPYCDFVFAEPMNLTDICVHFREDPHSEEFEKGIFFLCCTVCPKSKYSDREYIQRHLLEDPCGGRIIFNYNPAAEQWEKNAPYIMERGEPVLLAVDGANKEAWLAAHAKPLLRVKTEPQEPEDVKPNILELQRRMNRPSSTQTARSSASDASSTL